jgi:polysaccharide pyruvyl transferase WcaK-like protein
VQPVKDCADVVFARQGAPAQPHGVLEWVRSQRAGARIAIVNVSGLISGSLDQTPEYAKFVSYLNASGWSIVFLPHVSRVGNDDIQSLSLLASSVNVSDFYLVDELLSPDQVYELVSCSHLVLTGRMHLAVLSLLAGTYPITLATQGKVEGLYRILGKPELCVMPIPGFGDELVERCGDLISHGLFDQRVDDTVIGHLRDSSIKNFPPAVVFS